MLHFGLSRLALPMTFKLSVLWRGNLFNFDHFPENSSIQEPLVTV
jgi:hypothetical protein